tara:strand:+ start:26 stop:253 length:228 start_codon:yes stop_codon:yes gene_type:complete
MGLLNVNSSNFDKIFKQLSDCGAKFESEFFCDQGGKVEIFSDGAEITLWFDKNGVMDQLEINQAKVELKDLTTMS